MIVYICYKNYGYEGKSEPVKVYAREDLAKAWVDGASEANGTRCDYIALEVIE